MRVVSLVGSVLPVWLLLTVCGGLIAAEGDQTDRCQRMVIIKWNVEAGINNEVVRVLNVGDLVDVTQESSGFCWAASLGGWVPREALIPLDSVDTYFEMRFRDPVGAEDYHDRGVVRLALGRAPEAIQDFDRAVELRRGFVAALINRGRAHFTIDAVAESLRDLSDAVELAPDNPVAHNSLAMALAADGRMKEAVAAVNRALELQPDSVAALNNRGVLKRQLEEWAQAEQDFSQVVVLRPANGFAWSNRAYVRMRQHKFDAALNDYERALELLPDSRAVRNDFAWMLTTSSDPMIRNPRRALELIRAATERPDASVAELETLAAACAASGQWSEAVQTLDRALQSAEPSRVTELQRRRDLYRQKRMAAEPSDS